MTLHFNTSRDCCLKYHGIGPHDPDECESLMRPFAEEFARRQAELHPEWTIDLVPREFPHEDVHVGPLNACQWRVMFGRIVGAERREEAEWLVDPVSEANADWTAFLAAAPENIDAMLQEDVARLRRVSSLGVSDPVTMMCVLDAVLLEVNEVARVAPLHVFVRIGVDVCVENAGGQVTFLGDDEGHPCGMVVALLPSTSVGAIVHEAAHILNICQGEVEAGHGPQFVAALSETLRVIESTGCLEWIIRALSGEVPQTRESRRFPDLLDGGRWRMRRGGEVACATWCEEGAKWWGQGRANSDHLLRGLPEDEVDFALRSITCREWEFD